MINPDVYADLDHLFMLNFSVPAKFLEPLVPQPLTVLSKEGKGFPSIVMPKINNLHSVHAFWPQFNYEFMGLRILVEYPSSKMGPTKGIYFARLLMDPNRVRLLANALTDFKFEIGHISKVKSTEGCCVLG